MLLSTLYRHRLHTSSHHLLSPNPPPHFLLFDRVHSLLHLCSSHLPNRRPEIVDCFLGNVDLAVHTIDLDLYLPAATYLFLAVGGEGGSSQRLGKMGRRGVPYIILIGTICLYIRSTSTLSIPSTRSQHRLLLIPPYPFPLVHSSSTIPLAINSHSPPLTFPHPKSNQSSKRQNTLLIVVVSSQKRSVGGIISSTQIAHRIASRRKGAWVSKIRSSITQLIPPIQRHCRRRLPLQTPSSYLLHIVSVRKLSIQRARKQKQTSSTPTRLQHSHRS